MAKYTTGDLRNVAVVGHAGAGKTTLVEAVLHAAGVIKTLGAVDKGTTVSDFDPLEKEQQRSLASSLMNFDYEGKHVNVIDTPGYADFAGDALSVLPAVETALVVVNAQTGIEMMTQRMMDRGAERKLSRAIVVNRIDAEEVDVPAIVEQLREGFGKICLPYNLPVNKGTAVVDCFVHTDGAADFSSVSEAHSALIEQIVELDEDLMNLYLEQGDIDAARLQGAFKKALSEGHLVPILFTSAKHGVGVKELAEFITTLLPSPIEGTSQPFRRGEGDAAVDTMLSPDASKHAVAHVFRVSIDAFVGKMGMFRIHQGTITRDSHLYINDARKPFKVGHLFKVQGKDHIDIADAIPGDICAVAKIDEITRDVVLHDSPDDTHLHVVPMNFPVPMYGLAVQTKSRNDEAKISGALQKLAAEDPCFHVERNSETAETVLRGLGELHLRIMLARLKTRYNVEVDSRPPKIAYRETVAGSAEGHYRHRKQTGGAGQFGEVYLRIKPLARGAGFEFENGTFGGSIPAQYIPAVEKGVRQVLAAGAVAGYPMQDVAVEVYDGKYHAVDSKEIAFVTAGKRAFADAIAKARPQLLEPIVNIEVVVPHDHMGDIAGNLSSRRGRISGTEQRSGGNVAVHGIAPLAEVLDYQSFLKSVTAGRGTFSMEFSHYEAVPPNIQAQIVAAYKPRAEEED